MTQASAPMRVQQPREVQESCDIMRGLIDRFRQGGALDWVGAEAIVRKLRALIPPLPEPVQAMRAQGDYDEAHAVNMVLLCLTVTRELGFNEARTLEVGLAALMHDLGKWLPPSQCQLNPVTGLEDHGADALRFLADKVDVQPRIAEWIGDHHERADGSGPRQKMPVALETEIIGLCDLFDANLTVHPDRATLTAPQAWSNAMRVGRKRFTPEVTAAFEKAIAPYPPGSVVRLTGGYHGVVVRPSSPETPNMPVVLAEDGKTYDLSQFAAPRVIDWIWEP